MREEGERRVMSVERKRREPMIKRKTRRRRETSGSASCPDSACVLVLPRRRIAARLFTNPSSTRLPELPLGTRSPSPLSPRLSSAFNCSLSSTHHGSSASLPPRPASGPALVTVRREHPSSPTPRPFLVYNLACVSPTLLFKYSNTAASFRLRLFPKGYPPRGR